MMTTKSHNSTFSLLQCLLFLSLSAPNLQVVLANGCQIVNNGAQGMEIEQMIQDYAATAGLTHVVYRIETGDEVIASGAITDTTITGISAHPEMHFKTGNIAFWYLGTLLLRLAEDGHLNITDTIDMYLPPEDVQYINLPNTDVVTLEMLAKHTSGYRDYVWMEDFVRESEANPFATWEWKDLAKNAMAEGDDGTWCDPGTCWVYSHTNMQLLGIVMEVVMGTPLQELLETYIIGPQNLPNTAPQITAEIPAPVLHTYTNERQDYGLFEESTFWDLSWGTPIGSSITSNVCDLVASARQIGTGSLFKDPQSYNLFLSDEVASLPAPPCGVLCPQPSSVVYYGMGTYLMGNGWIFQTPSFGGTGEVIAYLPEQDLALAIVGVSGPNSEPFLNYANEMWKEIATVLSPNHIPYQPPSEPMRSSMNEDSTTNGPSAAPKEVDSIDVGTTTAASGSILTHPPGTFAFSTIAFIAVVLG